MIVTIVSSFPLELFIEATEPLPNYKLDKLVPDGRLGGSLTTVGISECSIPRTCFFFDLKLRRDSNLNRMKLPMFHSIPPPVNSPVPQGVQASGFRRWQR